MDLIGEDLNHDAFVDGDVLALSLGVEPRDGTPMIRMSWWLVDVVSRILEPEEREVVRGDFEEAGEAGGRALRDLLGLVVRRHASVGTTGGLGLL